MCEGNEEEGELKILVFSTETISDPGIDYAGSAHHAYSPSTLVVSVPCSSGIRPRWILHALDVGFDGVFIAADGSDCPFLPDCTRRTGELVGQAQELLKRNHRDPRRLKMAAICSVCADAFVRHMEEFERDLLRLGEGKGVEHATA